jgi:hypothetical protein
VDASVIVSIVALVSSIGGVYVANRFTAKTARQAQETTAEIESRKLDATAMVERDKAWKDDVDRLRARMYEDDQRHEQETAKLEGRLQALEEELRLVNRQRAFDRAHIDAMVAWSRIVVGMMKEAGITFPPPPPGISDTLPPNLLKPITD